MMQDGFRFPQCLHIKGRHAAQTRGKPKRVVKAQIAIRASNNQ